MANQALRIGIIGYSSWGFDKDEAQLLILDKLVQLKEISGDCELVSGLTAIGIPLLAYEAASFLKMRTVGIACSKAYEYDCYPCDEIIIVGDNWGDESETFLSHIDLLIKVGGGPQSAKEYASYTGPKVEITLEKNLRLS